MRMTRIRVSSDISKLLPPSGARQTIRSIQMFKKSMAALAVLSLSAGLASAFGPHGKDWFRGPGLRVEKQDGRLPVKSRPFPLRRSTPIESHPLCGCTAGSHLQTPAGEPFTRHPPPPLNVSLLGQLLQISNTPHAKHIFLQPSLTSRSPLSEGHSYRPSGIPFLREKKPANPRASRGALISSGSA